MSRAERRSTAWCCAIMLAWPGWCWAQEAAQPPAPPVQASGPLVVGQSQPVGLPTALSMKRGEVRTVVANQIQRVAVGDPKIADVSVMSAFELMVQAVEVGETNLIVWDQDGQHAVSIRVVQRDPEQMKADLEQFIEQFNLPRVQVVRKDERLFLVGEVSYQAEFDHIEQLVAQYPNAVNLVRLVEPPAPAAEIAPLVRLAVQVIEMSRSDLENLGVQWSKSVAVTEPEVTDFSFHDSLLRLGTSVTRGSFSATINALIEKNRARLLAEPKLVTASGKEASSFVGVEVPVIQATQVSESGASVSTSVEFKETGVILRMTPNVREDQRITMTLNAEVSSVDTASGLTVPVGTKTILVPGFKVRKAQTEVTTASGESVVIAGLLQNEDTKAVSQVPALGSMPVLGRLFRSPETKSTQTELVITVTPELVLDPGQAADKNLALEQAMSIAEVTASVEDPRLRYALQIQDRIAKALRYPLREQESGISGTVKLRLHLYPDGTLGRASVAESSGIQALDMEALKAAETQAPYPAFPMQLAHERELWLEIPVIFKP